MHVHGFCLISVSSSKLLLCESSFLVKPFSCNCCKQISAFGLRKLWRYLSSCVREVLTFYSEPSEIPALLFFPLLISHTCKLRRSERCRTIAYWVYHVMLCICSSQAHKDDNKCSYSKYLWRMDASQITTLQLNQLFSTASTYTWFFIQLEKTTWHKQNPLVTFMLHSADGNIISIKKS